MRGFFSSVPCALALPAALRAWLYCVRFIQARLSHQVILQLRYPVKNVLTVAQAGRATQARFKGHNDALQAAKSPTP
jgi:hypothetical protein